MRTAFKNKGIVMSSLAPSHISDQVGGQHKHMSLIESIVNVVIGYFLTVLIQYLLYPLFGIVIPARQALFISGLIVLISFVKNYALRRLFNTLHVNGIHRNSRSLFQRFRQSP